MLQEAPYSVVPELDVQLVLDFYRGLWQSERAYKPKATVRVFACFPRQTDAYNCGNIAVNAVTELLHTPTGSAIGNRFKFAFQTSQDACCATRLEVLKKNRRGDKET